MSAPTPAARPASEAELNQLLAELLGAQRHLATPVVRASAAYDSRSSQPTIRDPHSGIHRDLIPLTTPGPGEQYAFEVNLDACSGCKSCVAACHSLNGLDDHESWRDVGLLVSCDETPWQQTVTTACHHCAEPGCLSGCPVVAYEKDPLTGIVRHLDDQCIGCSYCILKCPYDVPKFNARLGIVRKCDMCHQRLAVGEAPACAQACPTQAIRIVTVASGHSAAVGTSNTGGPSEPEESSEVVERASRGFYRTEERPPSEPSPAEAPRPQLIPVERSSLSPSDMVGRATRRPSVPPPTGNHHSSPATISAHGPSAPAHHCGCDHGDCGCKSQPAVRPPHDGADEAKSLPQRSTPAVPLPPAIRSASTEFPVRPSSPARRHRTDTTHFLPAAPDPDYTQPTTRYVSARGLPRHVRAADAGALRVQPAHAPLVAMLVLTQLALGLLSTAPLIPLSTPSPSVPAALLTAQAAARPFDPGLLGHVNQWLTSSGTLPLRELVTYYVTSPAAHAVQLVALAALFAGLGASVLHLGRPLRAWRFFLGLRTSWLSREILAFNLLVPLACATLLWPASVPLRLALATCAAAAVFCSAMIYIDTRRRFWALAPSCVRFFGTFCVAALALTHPLAAALALAAKLGFEFAQSRGPGLPARLLRGPLRTPFALRLGLGLCAAIAFPFTSPWFAFAFFAAAEFAERLLFFRAVDAPKMPGHPASP